MRKRSIHSHRHWWTNVCYFVVFENKIQLNFRQSIEIKLCRFQLCSCLTRSLVVLRLHVMQTNCSKCTQKLWLFYLESGFHFSKIMKYKVKKSILCQSKNERRSLIASIHLVNSISIFRRSVDKYPVLKLEIMFLALSTMSAGCAEVTMRLTKFSSFCLFLSTRNRFVLLYGRCSICSSDFLIFCKLNGKWNRPREMVFIKTIYCVCIHTYRPHRRSHARHWTIVCRSTRL